MTVPSWRAALRAGLGVAAAAWLAGCRDGVSPEPPGSSSGSSPAGSSPTGSSSSGSSPAASTTTASPSEPSSTATSATPPPTRAQIVARYASARPVTWGLTGPGIVTTVGTNEPVVALTFDLCGADRPGAPGNGFDRDLVRLLAERAIPATFFVNARWLRANPADFDVLARSELVDIGNHGTWHTPLSVTGRSAYGIAGTANPGEVYDEVAGSLAELTARLGRAPRFLRAGTAHCDDVAVRIARDLGQTVVNFSVNADAGATFTAAQVATQLAGARGGDIVIGHANHPEGRTAEGFRAGLDTLLRRGLRPVLLRDYLRPG